MRGLKLVLCDISKDSENYDSSFNSSLDNIIPTRDNSVNCLYNYGYRNGVVDPTHIRKPQSDCRVC